ncbi:MAG: ATP-dependent RNA helicase HrpA [Thermoguttaceae bacterium]
MTDFGKIDAEIAEAMLVDQHRLRQSLRTLRDRQKQGKPVDREFNRLAGLLSRSVETRKKRAAGVPRIQFGDDLPVLLKRDEIAAAIGEHQVVVVSGETGSGKSTQLPKICLDMGRGVAGLIGHTQPRRIAARSIATRVAEEIGSPLGRDVGYKVRFSDETGPGTYIKLRTDGILLAETQGDRFLNQYDTIILDEAHERSLNVDFLIGYLKRLLSQRRDLKLIITSATIDSIHFSRHFRTAAGPAPVIEVSGRNYPVEMRYRPLVGEDEDDTEPDLERSVLDAVDELGSETSSGDVLIFMPTERHIHDMAKALRGRLVSGRWAGRRAEVLPLYARLPTSEQQRVFNPGSARRIIIATNVAESSLTVPGIRYVIDSGTARISRYSPRSKTQRLPIEPISQASADQRAGRCGRIGPGVCIRLYDEADYNGRDRFTAPEILRSNLASVILQTKALKLGDIERFPFLDPPKPSAIKDGRQTLVELGALDDGGELTELGAKLARMPVDPRIGRMVLAAADEGCLAEVLIIASVLEIRDPRERPVEKQQAADEAHAKFAEGESDFFACLKIWDFYHGLKDKLSRGQLAKACRQNFLSFNRMREWLDVHRQLMQLADETGLKRNKRQDDYDAVHRAILTGLLANLGMRGGEGYEYNVAGGSKAFLWPGSVLVKKRPSWVMAAESVETTRRYLRTCARIDPRWIEPLALHLVKRTYSEPHWQRESGSVAAFEKVTLFGLPIVARRRVAYGPVEPKLARELFIQHGLVEGDMECSLKFFRRNEGLLKRMERLQAKLRRQDVLLGDWARYEFYDSRVPDHVYDLASLKEWLKEAERVKPDVLEMNESDVVREKPADDAGQFPDAMELGKTAFPLEYRFEPGSDRDGITLRLSADAVGAVEQPHLDWLVPGLVEAKVLALIKSLPKPLRRRLVPAPDTARVVAQQIQFGQGRFLEAVAEKLTRIAGERIPASEFQQDKLPPELRMNVRIETEEGEVLAEGRDLDAVRRQIGSVVAEKFTQTGSSGWDRDGLTAWDMDHLPEEVELRQAGITIKAWPALVDRGESVSVRLFETPQAAAQAMRHGLRRLAVIAARRELKSQVQWLPGLNQAQVWASAIGDFSLKDQLAELIAELAFVAGGRIPRDRPGFERFLAEGRTRIAPAVQEMAGLISSLFAEYHKARLAVEKATSDRWAFAAHDAGRQLDLLVGPRFLTETPWEWLKHYPRYFKASGSEPRDRAATEEIAAHTEAWLNRRGQNDQAGVYDPELETYRWMLEEYRVSRFAQELGTSISVSAKKLQKQWEKVQ